MALSKTQRNKLKKLLGEACRKRDGYKCIKCSKTTALHTSHIYPVGREKKMEFIIDNVKTLCHRCHLYWFHKHPVEAMEWLQETMPDRLKKLKTISNSTQKGCYDYETIKKRLEDFINNI